MDFFKQVFQQINSIWQRLDIRQKVALILSLAAFLVTFCVFLSWMVRPEYSLLYSDLSFEDAGQITRKLREMNIPYKLKDEGKAIFVPASEVYETRLNLAMEGIPSKGEVGFEVFDNTSLIGMTNFMERINYQRALQGELARTIESMDEIVKARVHLVLPEESPFIGEESHPRASIVLRLRPGTYLTKEQVMGIAQVTVGSVEGLQIKDVTVVDQKRGILLGGEDTSSSVYLTTSQIELKRRIEQYLADKAQTLLSSVLGSGKAVVRVDAKLNFDQITTTQEHYDPESKVVKSEVRKEETSEGKADIIGGVPGTKTNLGEKNLIKTTNPGEQMLEESSVEYAISKKIEQIVKGVGNIERISVAAAIDGTYRIGSDGTKEYIPRSEQEMEKFTSMIKQAVGYDESRGDKVTVTNVPFDTSLREEEEAQWQDLFRWEFVRYMSRYIIIAVVILVLFLSLRKVTKILALTSPGGRFSRVGAKEESIPFEDDKWLKEHVFQLAEQDPKRVAQIIKIWMTNHGRA